MTEPRARKSHVWPRDPLDWYIEPSWCTAALLRAERFVGHIHDPACGQGNAVVALLAAGLYATGSDITARVRHSTPWFLGEADFLDPPAAAASWRFDNMVANPPYFRAKGTEAFARRALGLARGKVAIFTDSTFVFGSERAANLFAEHPPARVWLITPRPSCPPGTALLAGKKPTGGKQNFCWIVWDNTAPRGQTDLRWLKGDPNGR